MKRRRGDGLAVVGILVGAALAWSATGAALGWIAGRAAYGAVEGLVGVTAVVAVAAEQAGRRAAYAEATTEGALDVEAALRAEAAAIAAAAEAAVDAKLAAARRPQGVAFRASSLTSTSTVQGDYGGRLIRVGEELTLSVSVAQVRNSPDYGREDVLLVGVRLLLVEYAAGGERVLREGGLHPVREVLTPGEALWLEDLVLELHGVTEQEVADGWLVIEHVVGRRDPGVPRSSTYAFASQEVLWLLFDMELAGC